MVKKTARNVVLLHAHGTAGPKGRRSYLRFGTFKTRKAARENAISRRLDGSRIVPQSKVRKTKAKGLVYVSK